MSAALSTTPSPVPTTDRAARRAHQQDMPTWTLRACVRSNRAMVLSARNGGSPPMHDRMLARYALDTARMRAVLAARGEPLRALRTGHGRDEA